MNENIKSNIKSKKLFYKSGADPEILERGDALVGRRKTF